MGKSCITCLLSGPNGDFHGPVMDLSQFCLCGSHSPLKKALEIIVYYRIGLKMNIMHPGLHEFFFLTIFPEIKAFLWDPKKYCGTRHRVCCG